MILTGRGGADPSRLPVERVVSALYSICIALTRKQCLTHLRLRSTGVNTYSISTLNLRSLNFSKRRNERNHYSNYPVQSITAVMAESPVKISMQLHSKRLIISSPDKDLKNDASSEIRSRTRAFFFS